ncbi:MAG: alpha/beta fold hydrolase [Saprospiraceae bacterium]|nr:alpha/beta fold hydrolase [Saprospiraceae bacterium]
MPFIERSSFPAAPFWQYNGHLQTLVPGIMRRVEGIEYNRERIETPDGDFLDLDWIVSGHPRLLIITHGLEGNSTRQYVMGAAKLFSQNGYDVLAWNCRSCSGEMNRAFRMYHHGDTDDISAVVNHALGTGRYNKVVMTGFSMGANITLKYLGTQGEKLPSAIKAAAVFSAPCDLRSGAEVLDRWDNSIYRRRFLKALAGKMHAKSEQYPGRIDVSKLPQVKRWRDFDEWFSAPVCGYRNADDFYTQASARHFIEGLRIPTLLANAANDPILTPECMPHELARKHDFFHFEMPAEGGHCGFQTRGTDEFTWSERRALAFCEMW